MFPGEGYFLYEAFASKEVIFPELPGLELLGGRTIDDQPDLVARVARARAIARWYNGSKRGELPSRRLSDYQRVKKTKRFSQTIGVLSGFFGRAAKGDLVVVPPASSMRRMLIGELLEGPTQFKSITVPEHWELEDVPARSIRWLAYPLRGELSLRLQQRLPSPNAFRVLEGEDRAEIFSLAYGSFTIEDSYTSKFDVTSSDFSTKDDYYLQQIFNVIGALSQVLAENKANLAKDFSTVPNHLDAVIALLTDSAYVPTLAIDINSPGSLTLSCPRIVPLVAAALLALATLGADTTWTALKADQITIINSEAPDDGVCTPKVAAAVVDQLKLMGMERWQEMCQKAQDLKNNTGLQEKSKASVEVEE